MEKSLATVLCTVALFLCTTMYTVHSGDALRMYKKYIISSVADDELIMTANEGVYNKGLGTVVMEAYINARHQKWKYYCSVRGASVFKNEKNSYNNVSTYHEKDSYHMYNVFRGTKINDHNIYVFRNVRNREIGLKKLCLQSMGEYKAVQLLPCNREIAEQQWKLQGV